MITTIKKYKKFLTLILAITSYTSILANYTLNVVNLYPGPLNAISPNPTAESSNLMVWGIPKNAKPILLAKIPLGSEASLSWPGDLEKIHFFSATFASALENKVNAAKGSAALSQAFETVPGITTLTSTNMPASGSRIFVMPSVKTYAESPIKIVSTIPDIKATFAAMKNPYTDWTPSNIVLWLNNLINYLTIVKSKLNVLNIPDSTLATTIDQVIANYNSLKTKFQ